MKLLPWVQHHQNEVHLVIFPLLLLSFVSEFPTTPTKTLEYFLLEIYVRPFLRGEKENGRMGGKKEEKKRIEKIPMIIRNTR